MLPPVFWGCAWISLLATAFLFGLRGKKAALRYGLLAGAVGSLVVIGGIIGLFFLMR
jgi:hypothetical protein